MHFDRNPFHVLTCEGGKKALIISDLTLYNYSRFLSDGAAITAVKGLTYFRSIVHLLVLSRTGLCRSVAGPAAVCLEGGHGHGALHTPSIAFRHFPPKEFRIDSNDCGFICAGVNVVGGYK